MRTTNLPAYVRVVPDTEAEKAAKRGRQTVVESRELRREGPETVVLVVDDEPSIVISSVAALSRAGYKALGAQSDESALSIVRSHAVDVLLIDRAIPDMRGDVTFEVAAGYQPRLRIERSS
jgi:PleD family two-component response regulator